MNSPTSRSGRLAGKVALITGGGGGIGQGIALKMAEEGAAVVIADYDDVKGQQTEHDLRERGDRARFIHTDITIEDQVQAAVEAALSEFDHLNILVNNAGKNFYYNATQMSSAEWDNAMSVDLKGAWLCCKYAIPAMLKQGGGSIINIASVHATMTTYNMFPYAVAKSGLIGMTHSLALDWGPHNIRVNAVSPGWVRTYLMDEWLNQQPDPQAAEKKVLETQPLRRVGTPRDIANVVAFLASDEATYVSGTEIIVDGGLSAKFAE